MKSIGILGCGWMGFPLAKCLVQKGYTIKGSTRTEDKIKSLIDSGVEPYLVDLASNELPTAFFDCDVVFINVPPSSATQSGFERLAEHVKGLKVIFASSTSVYPNLNRVVTEADADYIISKHSGHVMLELEELFSKNPNFETTVLRFGGLFGPGRNPGNWFAGKSGLKGPNQPVNMIHLDDCIGIAETVIEQDIWGATFNACAPKHPTRKEFYQVASRKSGLLAPDFLDNPVEYKVVSSEKLIEKTGYQFVYPNPKNAL